MRLAGLVCAALPLLSLACRDGSPGAPDAGGEVDGSTGADAAPGGGARGLLFVRGTAGRETLYHAEGGREVALSDVDPVALCGGKIFCDLPPSPVLSSILFADFAGDDTAVFLEVSYGDPADSRVVAADLASGERTVLSEEVDWGPTDHGRPGWIDDHARDGDDHYWSLATADGMRLYRSTGRGPLVDIAHAPLAAPEYPIASWVEADGGAIAWSIETSTGAAPGGLRYHVFLLSAAGELRFSDADLPAGTQPCDPALVRGGTAAVSFTGEIGVPCRTWLMDADGGRRRPAARPGTASLPRAISPDGRRLLQLAIDFSRSTVHDAETGEIVDTFEGEGTLFSPVSSDLVVVRSRDNRRIELRDLARRSSRLLADGGEADLGFWGVNRPDQALTPDGERLVIVTGAPFSDLSDNLGLRALATGGGDPLEIEPPAISEQYFRQVRLSADGRRVVYLAEAGGQLDIAAYDLTDGSRAVLVESPEPERGFVLGDDF